MKMTLIALLAVAVCACGGKSSNGSGSTSTGTGTGTGTGPGTGSGSDGGTAATLTVQVNLVGAGVGRVTSQPAGIDCPGTCAMAVAPGTAVTLTATADANSHFEGYGGGCSGLSCAFTADATTKPIFANFSPLTPNPVQHTLIVAVAGVTGSVVSAPSGITCPGVCSAQFADGAKVALTATSTAGNTVTWSGACTGSPDCSLTLTADAAVTATFSDPCAGVVTALPTAAQKTFFVQEQGPGAACQSAISDGDGNVYVQSIGGRAFVSGSAAPPFPDVLFDAPLQTGFLGDPFVGETPNTIRDYTPAGTIASSIALPPSTAAFSQMPENFVDDFFEVTVSCGASGATLTFFHVDGAAQATSQVFADTACPAHGGLVVVDEQGHILLVDGFGDDAALGVPANHLAARWFDATAKPVTAWFDAGPAGGDITRLRPQIGGGAALRVGSVWHAIAHDATTATAAPSAFASGKDVIIVSAGKAYVAVPDFSTAGSLDVVTPGGRTCGTLAQADETHVFFVGRDRTLIELQGNNTCGVSYFPQLLK